MSYEVAQLALSANVRMKSPYAKLATVGLVIDAVEEEEKKEEMYNKVVLDLAGV